MELVYKNEKPLFVISLVIGSLVWLGLVVGTIGIILLYALLGLLLYLFAQSGFIAHLRGNAVELAEDQFPDLYRHYRECCAALGMEEAPRAYLMMSDGVLNALATKFLRRHYVVLYSSVVEALRSRPEALRFYFGHELAHIKRGHLNLRWLLFPASILPLLGAAYRRAQEYTCDLHGLRTSTSPDDAVAALVVLGSGGELLPRVNVDRFVRQQAETGGFWMSFHEFTNDYPWLCKRVAHLAGASGAGVTAPTAPRRSFFAGLIALFVPRFGLGAAGGMGSLIVTIVIIGILAAIAIPAYQDYTVRSQVTQALNMAGEPRAAVTAFIEKEQAYPESLEQIGVQSEYPDGPLRQLALTEDGLELTLRSAHPAADGQTILFSAYRADDGSIGWDCTGGTLPHKHRPVSCRASPAAP